MSEQATPQESLAGQIAARVAEAGKRAKAEADARREKAKEEQGKKQLPPELGGPKGPEPTRYGDWEHKGIAVDF